MGRVSRFAISPVLTFRVESAIHHLVPVELQREVPFWSPPLLLRSKVLQDAVMQPDPLAPAASRGPLSISTGSQVFMLRITISCSRMGAASSLAWRPAWVGLGGFGRQGEAMAPPSKSSSCRGAS